MRFTIRSIRVAAPALALLVMLPMLPLASAGEAKSSRKVVAKVNGAPLYDDALATEMKRLANKGWTTGMAGNSEQATTLRRSTALETMITAELLRQASSTTPVADMDEKIEHRIKAMRQKYPSEEDFGKSLRRKQKTLDGLKSELRGEVLLQEYLKTKRVYDAEISDAAIEKFYNENKGSFPLPEQIKVRHILVDIDGSTQEQNENSLKKASEIRDRIIRQKDFAAVAKQSSTCSSASKGGDLGYVSRGYMPAEFDKVAFSLKVGEISEPVKTQHGFHIIEVLDRKPASVRSLQEVKDFIAKFLKGQAETERMKALVAELRSKAKIEVLPD